MTRLPEPTGPARPTQPLDALVVLGCRAHVDGKPGPALRRRVDRAAALYRMGLSERVVMSGGRRWGAQAEADAMLTRWLELGLDPDAVLLERRSLTTRGNAHCCGRLLVPLGVTRIGLVTCDYHLPRAARHFAAEGLSVRGYAATVTRTPIRRLWLWSREVGAHLLERAAPGRAAHWIEADSDAPSDPVDS